MKRDGHGKFSLKNKDYRLVRSLRLTDETWKALGNAADGLGLTKADYLEQIVRDQTLPCITRKEEETQPSITRIEIAPLPSITWQEEEVERLKAQIQDLSQEHLLQVERATNALPQILDLESLRDRVLLDLKLGKQASGYKAAQKALNRFITELTHPKSDVF